MDVGTVSWTVGVVVLPDVMGEGGAVVAIVGKRG